MIVLGVQDKDKKEQGLYVHEGSTSTHAILDSNLLFDPEHNNRETPRTMYVHGQDLYVLTKNFIKLLRYNSNKSCFEEISSRNFRTLGLGEEILPLVGEDNLCGSIAVDSTHNLYLGLYGADTGKKVINSQSCLLQFTNCDLNSTARRILDISPTGAMCADTSVEEGVLVPARERIQVLKQGLPDQSIYPFGREGGKNVLALHALEDILLVTDTIGGYFIQKGLNSLDRCAGFGFSYLSNHTGRNYLPMEGTSVLLVKHHLTEKVDQKRGMEKEKYYALFGSDNSKLFVYELDFDTDKRNDTMSTYTRKIGCSYLKTITFFSSQKLQEPMKSNIVEHLRYNNGYVSFTLRDIFMRVGIDTLLTTITPGAKISFNEEQITDERGYDEQSRVENYVHLLKKRYSLDFVCRVPHRITSWAKYGGIR